VLPPQKPRPYWNDGVLQPACLYGSEWIINKHFLYEHGVALWGPDFKTLTKPVDIKDVQAACIRDLFKEWEPKINQPAWFDNPHYQSYLVLNLCRILCAVQGNRITTKKEAAAWVKKEYGPRWQDLVETAENWRYGMAMEKKEEAIEFIEWVVDKANKKKR
jgi:hypothetical protein